MALDDVRGACTCVFLFVSLCAVIVISARGNVVRSFLIEAHRKGLTNGEFVFFCLEPYKHEDAFGSFDWKQGFVTLSSTPINPEAVTSRSLPKYLSELLFQEMHLIWWQSRLTRPFSS